MNKLIFILIHSAAILFIGCSDKQNIPEGSFLGAAAIGDLISLDIKGNQFEFKGVVGKLENVTLKGRLEQKKGFSRHVYSSPDVPGVSLVITPETISYHEDGNNFGKYGVVIRKTDGYYKKENLAGMYNYVSQARNGSGNGTFLIKSDGSWFIWHNANGTTETEENAQEKGEWVDSGAGYLRATTSGGFNAHVMINPSGVLVIDLVSDGGIAIGMRQNNIAPVIADYDVIQSNRNDLYSVKVDNASIEIREKKYPLSYNKPWGGFAAGPDFFGLLSPDAETFFGLASSQLFVAIKK